MKKIVLLCAALLALSANALAQYEEFDSFIIIDSNGVARQITCKLPICDSDDVYTVVEVDPEFPGGLDSMYAFIRRNINLKKVEQCDATGKIFVGVIVEPNGSLSDIRIMRDIGCGIGEEIARIVGVMPKWKPGIHRGKSVRVRYYFAFPFTFPYLKENQ